MKMNNSIASAFAIAPASSLSHEQTAAPASAPGEDEEKKASKSLSGFIFLCNGRSKPECYKYRVFGLPLSKVEVVEKIKTGTKLFLFDFDVKLLYGVYEATSNGKVGLEPLAFGGRFPAQVQFRIYKGSLPLHENSFKHAIKDNYRGSRFEQELDEHQVRNLISLFRPLYESSSSSASPAPMANIGPTLPKLGPPKGTYPSAVRQPVKHLSTVPFGEDPYAGIGQGHVRNIQVSHHGWQGMMPIRDRFHKGIDPGFAPPSKQIFTTDSHRHVPPSSYPYYTANGNLNPPIHQYYTADVQERNIAAHRHPYHSAAAEQLNATPLTHQYYSTDSQNPNVAAPSHPYHSADVQERSIAAHSHPYHSAASQQLNATHLTHQYYSTDSQNPNVAAPSNPYHSAAAQQLNATPLTHQYYTTDSLNPNVALPSHPSCTADSQQLNTAVHIQQYYSTYTQQVNVEAGSHPCFPADSQLRNATAPSHHYYVADSHQPCDIDGGAAQLRQESYFRSMHEAAPQDQLMGTQHNYQQLPQQMHQQSADAFSSNPILSAPYGSLLTQPGAPQAVATPQF
ncbi:unnamed protein product [Cuscuta europaea]|uniref:DCD domain-containing protein n=1 Tax=Cuscuta europaea TaxID=41803 RepID=A0A9P1EH88_CUSEU|nr:unnamed protein product [Cuscuta europaea]